MAEKQENLSSKAPKDARFLANRLLTWFKTNARDLPWRKTKDPYKIWVSEIMLQQTQVDTVIPYYLKWIKKFPSTQKLARASLDEALEFWAGLGYYRRAKMLHAGAQAIQKSKSKIIPDTVTELQNIPGIGKYTAGAIASIAYGKRAPLVDGNVMRVYARFFDLDWDISQSKAVKKFWELAEACLPQKAVGVFNEALMELGATVCTPQTPKCSNCPVKARCLAFKENRVHLRPVNSRKVKLTRKNTYAMLIRNHDKILLQKQNEGEAWAGLWTLPYSDKKQALSFYKTSLKPIHKIEHGYTKYKVLLSVFETKVMEKRPSFSIKPNQKWVPTNHLGKYPVPSPYKKLFSKLEIKSRA